MLDIKKIRSNSEEIKANLAKRNFQIDQIDQILELDQKRREILTKTENLQAEQNQVSKEIQKADHQTRPALLEKSKNIKAEIKALEPALNELDQQQNQILSAIPNLLDSRVPEGKDENDNLEVSKWGEPTKIENPLDHVELATNLGILDLERASKISGARFALLKAAGAKLERALASFMLDQHLSNGFTEVAPPYLVNAASLFGTGQLPKFKEDLFEVPHNEDSLFLIPTAEVPITNIHRNEILDEKQLPIRYTALTPCFRSEAGSYGKDTKGIIRQHQFNKVEMVCLTTPENGSDELELITNYAEKILQALELPYRKMMLCSRDTGFSAAITYDLEVWIPSQNTYREISSCSLVNDFQARRAAIRFKSEKDQQTQFVSTLNGSGLAVGRTWVAVLENYQQADGSILIPKVLQPYMNGLTKIEKNQ